MHQKMRERGGVMRSVRGIEFLKTDSFRVGCLEYFLVRTWGGSSRIRVDFGIIQLIEARGC